ncbi:MAG: 30S ribosomal protein S21 [Nodosilinea sp.]|jgi:small subunit ribosomal protein S21
MTQITVGEEESLESALRRFKRKVSRADIFSDMRKNRHFETPPEKRKRKTLARHKQQRWRNRSKSTM